MYFNLVNLVNLVLNLKTMSAQARLQKMLEVLIMLNCRYGRTLRELCEEFDISERTAYRYIETIRNAGFVIDRHESLGKHYYRINKEESQQQLHI